MISIDSMTLSEIENIKRRLDALEGVMMKTSTMNTKSNKTPIKIEHDGIVYYTYLEWIVMLSYPSPLELMQLSSFAVNIKTNEVVKCPTLIEDTIDLMWEKYNERN